MNTQKSVIATIELVGRWGGDDLDDARADLSTFRAQILAAAESLGRNDKVEILYDRVLAESESAQLLLSFLARARVLLLGRGLLVRGSVTFGQLRGRREEITVGSGTHVTWHAFGLDIGRAYMLEQYMAGIGIFIPATFLRSTAEDITDMIVESEFVGGAPRAFPRRFWDVKLRADTTDPRDYANSLDYVGRILRHSRSLGRQLIPLIITCIRSGWATLGEYKGNVKKLGRQVAVEDDPPPSMDSWLLTSEIISRLKGVPGGTFPYLALLDWLFDARREDNAGVTNEQLRSAITTVGRYAFLRESLLDAPETLLGPENRIEIDRYLLNPGSGLTVATLAIEQ